MRYFIKSVVQSNLFMLFFNIIIIQVAFSAVVIATLDIPPDVILDSGLDEVLIVFEE